MILFKSICSFQVKAEHQTNNNNNQETFPEKHRKYERIPDAVKTHENAKCRKRRDKIVAEGFLKEE